MTRYAAVLSLVGLRLCFPYSPSIIADWTTAGIEVAGSIPPDTSAATHGMKECEYLYYMAIALRSHLLAAAIVVEVRSLDGKRGSIVEVDMVGASEIGSSNHAG